MEDSACLLVVIITLEGTSLVARWLKFCASNVSGEGNGKPLQYSLLENPMDRRAWPATVHGIARVGHDLATKPPPPLPM